jgi:hypothetical protein
MTEGMNTSAARGAWHQLFVCYRREDTAGHALLLKDALDRVPGVSVFLDVHSIPAGVDFVEHARERVAACHAVLVLIGDEWLRSRNDRQRLHDEDDHVRTEIRWALERKVDIYPVLVERASMPKRSELPEDICKLAHMHAVEIFDHSWREDLGRLVEALGLDRTEQQPSEPLKAPTSGSMGFRAAAFPGRLTGRWIADHVPRLSRTELAALIAELRSRGYYEADVERTVKRSRFRPPKKLPPRVTQAWLEEAVPLMTTYQLRETIKRLKDRQWTAADIEQRVMPLAATFTVEPLPRKITMSFLEERALLLPSAQARELARTMRARGWDEEDIDAYVPHAA